MVLSTNRAQTVLRLKNFPVELKNKFCSKKTPKKSTNLLLYFKIDNFE